MARKVCDVKHPTLKLVRCNREYGHNSREHSLRLDGIFVVVWSTKRRRRARHGGYLSHAIPR